MNRPVLSNFKAGVVLVLSIVVLTGCARPLKPSGTPAKAPAECISQGWPHDRSDLRPDPRLTFGTLANGFRYVIMPNSEPEGRVGLYLDIQAGSLHETDEQRGYAHFLEHMLFNGTTHYPPGTLVEYFQTIGMSFGADTNAHTGFDETVYKILLPAGDEKSLADGLLVMADYARGALLLEQEVDRERGVILAEKRTRDSVGYRLYEKKMRFSFSGTRLVDRFPIGTEETLARATGASLRDYYDTWYRPENMIMVVVGDVDRQSAVRLIKERFSPLSAPAAEPRCFAYGRVREQGEAALYIHEPEKGNTEVTLASRWNVTPGEDSLARQSDIIRRYVAASLLNNRLEKLVGLKHSPMTRARTSTGEYLRRFGYVSITAVTSDKWRETLQLIAATLRQALVYGFSERELDRVRREIMAELEKEVQVAAGRDSRKLAAHIIDRLNSNEVITSPADDLKLFGPVIERLTPAEINRVFRDLWSRPNRQYLVAGTARIVPQDNDPESAILAFADEIKKIPVEEWESGAGISFPYLQPEPVPAAVARREVDPDTGIETVSYQGTTVLNIKKTDFQPNEVMVAVHFGGGRLAEPRPGMGMLAESVVRESGFGRLAKAELKGALAGHPLDFRFRTGAESFSVNVKGMSRDLEFIMQLIMTQLRDPALRDDAYQLSRERFGQMYDQMTGSVEGMMELKGERFLAGGDSHFGLPDREQFMDISLQELRDWLLPVMQSAALEVSVVGDVDPDKVVDLTGRYLGGPERRGGNLPEPLQVNFPRGGKLRLDVTTGIDKGMVVVAWPTDDFWDISRTRRLNILAAVLDDRLRLEIREKLGAVYSPSVYNVSSRISDGYGVLRAVLTVDPGQADFVVARVRSTVRNLVEKGIAEDELHRALEPVMTSIRDMVRTNRYWMNSVLALAGRHPEQLHWPLTIQEDFAGITVDEIHELAVRYLEDAASAEIVLLPNAR